MDTRNPAGPQTAASPLSLGAEGETRAARYLRRRGYRIVGRNVRAGGVELDLIARRGRQLIFVEVKTRRSLFFGPPELAVDGAKRARLVAGANAWLHEYGRDAASARFDVIAWEVTTRPGGGTRWSCRHIVSAFDAED